MSWSAGFFRKKFIEKSRSEAATNPRHHEEEKKAKNERLQNKRTHAREAHIPAPSFPSKVIAMLRGLTKHEYKEQGNTKHEALRSINHNVTQNKNISEPLL